jgi:hypothetical protein
MYGDVELKCFQSSSIVGLYELYIFTSILND